MSYEMIPKGARGRPIKEGPAAIYVRPQKSKITFNGPARRALGQTASADRVVVLVDRETRKVGFREAKEDESAHSLRSQKTDGPAELTSRGLFEALGFGLDARELAWLPLRWNGAEGVWEAQLPGAESKNGAGSGL